MVELACLSLVSLPCCCCIGGFFYALVSVCFMAALYYLGAGYNLALLHCKLCSWSCSLDIRCRCNGRFYLSKVDQTTILRHQDRMLPAPLASLFAISTPQLGRQDAIYEPRLYGQTANMLPCQSPRTHIRLWSKASLDWETPSGGPTTNSISVRHTTGSIGSSTLGVFLRPWLRSPPITCPGTIESKIKGPSAVPDKIYRSSADLLHRKQGDMAGSWLVHAVPGLEARGLCPPAPPLRRLACTCCSRAGGWGAVPPCTAPLMLA